MKYNVLTERWLLLLDFMIMLYSVNLTNFSMDDLVICNVYTDVVGIKLFCLVVQFTGDNPFANLTLNPDMAWNYNASLKCK